MDAAKSPPSASPRSKKQSHSPAPSDNKARKVPESDPNPWGVKTPSKPADPPRRLCNRRAAMSIKEIREAAMKLRGRRSDPPEPIEPVVESKVESVAKPNKPSGSEIKLPEKYELLDKFFNSLDSSIRLLQLKGSAPVFANICPQVESLTDRRFTYSHLAQLKFIMPKAIMLEKVLRHDERTSCMRPDLRITLNVEAVKSKNNSQSLGGNLREELSFQYTSSPLQPCPERESTELHLAVRRGRRICRPSIRLTYSRKRKRGRQGLQWGWGIGRKVLPLNQNKSRAEHQCSVAIWSSKMRKNVDPILIEMSQKMRRQLTEELKFVWGQDKCKKTSSFLKDNPEKPVMFKELEQFWRVFESYDTTNTVLVDDSPYKLFLNPLHNAIFLKTYNGSVHDNYLDLEGKFVNYLTKLADADDVQSYIRQNPIDYENIKQGSEEWNYNIAIADCFRLGANELH
ncbi:CDT1-like protein a- chloroplastic [Striga hermonthica]|uniref:CDT1-like protein a- chloroplastic n=1 Tax=Striga hermonthica TaxID=68872 RepID=A0A9N7N185_STRHE|nr:CDT1-like protein a- chloroplastic [Striga hermonthica]